MLTKIQKWGNSNAIRIPKIVLDEMKIVENDQVEIKVIDGNIVIIPVKKVISLKERMKGYTGDYKCSEWDTGESVGNEIE